MRFLCIMALVSLSTPTFAEDILYEPQYWNDESLFLNESSGNFIESILTDNINFEPLVFPT